MDPGSVVGVVSLAIQCLQVYQYFVEAAKFPEASRELLFQIDMERYKLKIWSRMWGIPVESLAVEDPASEVGEGAQDESDKDDAPLLAFCTMRLKSILQLLTHADDWKSTYGLKVEETKRSQQSSSLATLKNDTPRILRRKTLEALKRITWSVQDQSRVQTLLVKLRNSNEDLYMVFPPNIQRLDVERVVVQGLVAKNRDNAKSLQTLRSESRKAAVDILEDGRQVHKSWQQRRTNVYLSAAGVAELAMSRLSLRDAGALEDKWQIQQWTSEFDEDIVSALSSENPRGISQVKMGTRVSVPKGSKVLLEWRRNEEGFSEEIMLKRVYDLVQLLNPSIEKPTYFCLLDCIGFFADGNKFILIFKIAPVLPMRLLPSISTTGNSIRNSQEAPAPTPNFPSTSENSAIISLFQFLNPALIEIASLSYRFGLARKIAQAVTSMHACGWVHKGIKSKNILFFGTEELVKLTMTAKVPPEYPSIMESPFLSGFSYSRPDESEALSGAKNTTNIYLHPAYLRHEWGRYKLSYDIYSLGLVLLEIARWIPLEKFWEQDKTKCSDLGDFQVLMLARAQKLGYYVGDIYRDVVVYCLTCSFEDEDSVKERVRYIEEVNEKVVMRLQNCVA